MIAAAGVEGAFMGVDVTSEVARGFRAGTVVERSLQIGLVSGL